MSNRLVCHTEPTKLVVITHQANVVIRGPASECKIKRLLLRQNVAIPQSAGLLYIPHQSKSFLQASSTTTSSFSSKLCPASGSRAVSFDSEKRFGHFSDNRFAEPRRIAGLKLRLQLKVLRIFLHLPGAQNSDEG